MKLNNRVFFSLLVLGMLLNVNLFAQSSSIILNADGDEIHQDSAKKYSEAALMHLLDLATENEYYKVSKMMVYSGRDQRRDLVSMMNYKDPYDRLDVERASNEIKDWLRKSTIHVHKNFRHVPGWKFDLYVWDVEFTNKRGKTKARKFIFTTNKKKEFLFVRADEY